jgi:hypothetical protein
MPDDSPGLSKYHFIMEIDLSKEGAFKLSLSICSYGRLVQPPTANWYLKKIMNEEKYFYFYNVTR